MSSLQVKMAKTQKAPDLCPPHNVISQGKNWLELQFIAEIWEISLLFGEKPFVLVRTPLKNSQLPIHSMYMFFLVWKDAGEHSKNPELGIKPTTIAPLCLCDIYRIPANDLFLFNQLPTKCWLL